MAIGETAYVNTVREQLLAGRARLSDVLGEPRSERVLQLLEQVDSALHHIELGTFGLCENCHDTIEEDRLAENPLVRVCLGCLTPEQQRALEYDLELAGQIQKGLLPPCDVAIAGWDVCYHYEPAGVVSGDYCDLIEGSHGKLHFVLADVSGKGVAAAMLSSNLRAIFRSLIPMDLGVEELMNRANRLFRESALPNQYATMVYGRATREGAIEIVNAGHLPVFLASGGRMTQFDSTNQPLGMFDGSKFTATKQALRAGDTLVLYTDGISEAQGEAGDEYGVERLRQLVAEHGAACAAKLVGACKEHLSRFRGHDRRDDDETLLVMQFTPAAAQQSQYVAV